MVFNLIDLGAFGKREQDRREDFSGGYDFQEAFVTPFLPVSTRGKKNDTGSRRLS